MDQFTKSQPPGWKPGNARYPLRRYFQLLSLWWRQTDVQEHAAGAAIAGRLRGSAFQLALRISENRVDQITHQVRRMTGDELLAQPSFDTFTDAAGIVHQGQVSGAHVLMRELRREYGIADQDLTRISLDAFSTIRAQAALAITSRCGACVLRKLTPQQDWS